MKNSTTIKVVKTKEESRFGRMKQMLTNTLTKKSPNHIPTNFEEAKNMCKARKRKERQESIGSISQERKVIRSSSEERSNSVKQDGRKDIRRVVSHEDFQKARPTEERKDVVFSNSPCRSLADILDYEDSEHERRRHQERFALPLIQRGRRIKRGRKFSKKCFTKKCTNNNELTVITSYETELEEIPRPKQSENDFSRSESSDLSVLLQGSDPAEPIPSASLFSEITDDTDVLPMGLVANERLLLSPRNSIIAQHRIFLDPNIQKTKTSLTKDSKNPLDKRLKQLSKQISSMKKKLKSQDEEFQLTYGYKASQADKMNDKTMRKCITEINKLKKDYKQLKSEGGTLEKISQDSFKVQTLLEAIKEIEKNLTEKRIAGGRSDNIEQMTDDQIVEEKIAMQQSLLYLESVHGRPTNKEDRDLLRPLYDRYRAVKRLVVKVSTSCSAISELATILEDEALDFITSPPQTSESEKLALSGSSESEIESSLSESLHTLTLDELIKHQKETNAEKKNLRHALKKFENEFQLKTGRKLQKDDKALMANVYISYKQMKAKSRLLDALVTKQLQA